MNSPVTRKLILVFILALAAVHAQLAPPTYGPADAGTVALWLFDEDPYHFTTLTDGSPVARADLTLMEDGQLVAGRYGRALAGAGAGYRVAYAGYAGKVTEGMLREKDGTPSGLWAPTEGPAVLLETLAGDAWAIEFWLKSRNVPAAGAVVIDLGQAFEPGFTLSVGENGFVLDNAYAGWSGRIETDPAAHGDGQWHHHTFVVGRGGLAYVLDGKARGSIQTSPRLKVPLPDPQMPADRVREDRGFKPLSPEERRERRFNIALLEDRRAAQRLDAALDEVRFAKAGAVNPTPTLESYSRSGQAPAARRAGPQPLFANQQEGKPLDFGARKHVFIDDALLETKSGVELRMNLPGHQTRIDLVPDRSAWRPAVFDHDGQVYMMITDSYGSSIGDTHLATSHDGIHFKLERRIITAMPMYTEAFRDLNPDAVPEEAFKMTGFIANRGVYLFTSPDGRRWRKGDTTMLPIRSGGGAETYFDDQRGVYVCILRRDSSYDGEGDAKGPGKGRRGVQFESDRIHGAWPFRKLQHPYFEGWPFPAVTNEGEVVFMPNELGQPYRSRVFKYPWAPDTYVCFVWRFEPASEVRQVELGTSRDGRNWRYWGPWYIGRGDRAEALSLYGLIRRGDEIWQYSDHGDAHGGSAPRDYYRWTQRLDGFVSLDAGAGGGTAVTRPLTFAGERLEVNVQAAGAVRVALLDAGGREIPGFGLADCMPVTGDSVRHRVTWKSPASLREHGGRPVRVKFELRDARLFAFEFLAGGRDSGPPDR